MALCSENLTRMAGLSEESLRARELDGDRNPRGVASRELATTLLQRCDKSATRLRQPERKRTLEIDQLLLNLPTAA